MDILNLGSANAALMLSLLVPGVLSLKVYDLIVPGAQRTAGIATLEALAYGTVNLALLYAPAAWLVANLGSQFALYGAIVLGMLVLPALIGVGAAYLRQRSPLRRLLVHPTPKGWDYFFQKREACWVLFHLRDGRMVGGLFGPRSLASSFPHTEDVYVEQA